jgi:ketopantoate hydroxymethyltransferase
MQVLIDINQQITFLLIGPSIENQQMHQNDHFIVTLSHTLLHVSAYQRHLQGAHMILTSCLYVGVHCRRNNGISSVVAPISIVTLWI